MKRDIHFVRQLALEIERHGADCAIETLFANLRSDRLHHDSLNHGNFDHDAEEWIRHHLRLLVDAGWVKDTDRTATSGPCVRLTNAGHEFIELARSEKRWRTAVALVRETTGGVSLAVLRQVLARWALRAVAHGDRRLRQEGLQQRDVRRNHRGRLRRAWLDRFAVEGDPLSDDDQAHLVRRPNFRERADTSNGANDARGEIAVKLPEQLI